MFLLQVRTSFIIKHKLKPGSGAVVRFEKQLRCTVENKRFKRCNYVALFDRRYVILRMVSNLY